MFDRHDERRPRAAYGARSLLSNHAAAALGMLFATSCGDPEGGEAADGAVRPPTEQ
jgi:hypothetical protein